MLPGSASSTTGAMGERPVCMRVSSSKPSSMVPNPPGSSAKARDSFMKVSLRVKKYR